jgi:hypothetical protein
LYGTVCISIFVVLWNEAAQVRRRSEAGVGEVDLALVGLEPLQELGVGVRRQRRLADQRHRHLVDHAEVLEVFQRLVLQVAVQRGRGGDAGVGQQQGVAIRCRLRHLGGTQRAAGAADVLHDERRVQRLAHRFGEVARHLVGGAAGREGHDDGDRLVGVLGERGGSRERGHGSKEDTVHGGDSFVVRVQTQIVGTPPPRRTTGTT